MSGIAALMDEIDDWCGTGRRPVPPRPPAFRDILIAVAVHDLAAQLNNGEFREQIQGHAANLFQAAARDLSTQQLGKEIAPETKG